ncbi:MAG: phosphoglucosamine mutase [Nocardioidaceae bacterium]
MARLFGTDGVRGLANRDLTADLALDLAVSAAHVLGSSGAGPARRPFAVVGRDPRASGEFLEAAVVAGLASAGADVRRLGVLPTPAVAYLTAREGADFGVMLSASHNPMPDNGIKFFARGGVKLDDSVEDAIETYTGRVWERPIGAAVGRVVDDVEAVEHYLAHLASTVSVSLAGLRLVLDCAEGAAFQAAPRLFERLGADVVAIHNSPDGININHLCGSTDLASLRDAVVAADAAAGFAFDGDADRCLAVDATGQPVDGDELLAVLALARRDAANLPHDTVVATVMSNLGFMLAMRKASVNVVQVKVGDRYVLEAMRSGGFTLGGEQSGHVIMSDHATTGDGLLTALHVAARMADSGRTLADLAGVMTKLPQVLINVPDVDKARSDTDATVASAVHAVELELGDTGRVLLRPSGTESLVRVMVEAPSADQAASLANRLADVVKTALAW